MVDWSYFSRGLQAVLCPLKKEGTRCGLRRSPKQAGAQENMCSPLSCEWILESCTFCQWSFVHIGHYCSSATFSIWYLTWFNYDALRSICSFISDWRKKRLGTRIREKNHNAASPVKPRVFRLLLRLFLLSVRDERPFRSWWLIFLTRILVIDDATGKLHL